MQHEVKVEKNYLFIKVVKDCLLILLLMLCNLGAKEITRVIPAYLGDCFWRNIFKRVLIKSFKILKNEILSCQYLCKRFQKMSFQKKLKPIYKFFLWLKTTITMFNQYFWELFIHWIFFKLIYIIHVPMIY